MDLSTKAICLALAVSVAIGGFPWFRTQLWVLDVSPMHVVIVGVCALHFVRGLKVINKEWLICAAMLVLLIALNLVQANDDFSRALGLRLTVKLTLCLIVAIGVAGVAARNEGVAELFVDLTATVIVIIGLALFYYSFFVLGEQFINVSPDFAEGSYIDRNQSSFTFALGAVTSFALLMKRQSPWRFIRTPALIMLMALGGSRGAILAGSAGIASCALLWAKDAVARRYILVILIAAYAASGYIPTLISDRFEHFLVENPQAEDFGFRDELGLIAFTKLLPEAPIVGHGSGTAVLANGRFYSENRRVDPHSDMNLLAIEDGLLGLALYATACAILLGRSFSIYRRLGAKGSGVLLVYLPLIVFVFVHGFGETQIDVIQIWMVYGVTSDILRRLSSDAGSTGSIELTRARARFRESQLRSAAAFGTATRRLS